MLAHALAGAHLADVALAALLAEALVLGLYRWRTGRGLTASALVGVLLPGACLLLALRSVPVPPADAGAVGLFLGAALLAHVADLRRRWRQQALSHGARAATAVLS